MDDRELLELAAKASGLWDEKNNCIDTPWSPLTDDGDALRLAVKLEINILPTMEEASARNPSHTGWTSEDASRDPYAATRRAIVRAAAALAQEQS